MIDEHSPEMQRALAPYYDSVGQFNRKTADRIAEADEASAKREKEYEERASKQREELTQALAERDAKRKQEAEQAAGQNRNPNDAWRSSRQQVQDLQFGPEEEYGNQPYHGSAQPAVPSAPVAQDPWTQPQNSWTQSPAPARQPPPEPAAPPPSRPPARHQRPNYGEDDDDMSNQSWLQ